MSDCVFCKIIKGEIPCHKIYEDENVLAFLDISCDIEGHTLVIPKEHCRNILDCGSMELLKTLEVVQRVSRHYVENCGFDGVNLFNNNEKAANQCVFHLHFHVYPRKTDDGFNLNHNLGKAEMDLGAIAARLKI